MPKSLLKLFIHHNLLLPSVMVDISLTIVTTTTVIMLDLAKNIILRTERRSINKDED